MRALQRHCMRANLHIYKFACVVTSSTQYIRFDAYLALQWNDFVTSA